MPSQTTIGLDKPTAEDLRQAAREMSAREHKTLTMSEVVRALVRTWRQFTGEGEPA